jgi:hypothetical protein
MSEPITVVVKHRDGERIFRGKWKVRRRRGVVTVSSGSTSYSYQAENVYEVQESR